MTTSSMPRLPRWPSAWAPPPAELRRQLDTAGRTGAVRSELRKGKALEWLLDHVELFDEEGNPMSRDDLRGGCLEGRRSRAERGERVKMQRCRGTE